MIVKKSILLYLFLLQLCIGIQAQSKFKFIKDKTDKERLDSALHYSSKQQYDCALTFAQELLTSYANEPEIIFLIGKLYTQSSYQNDLAYTYLKQTDPKKFSKEHAYFYFGLAAFYKEKFEDAELYLNTYLNYKSANKEWIDQAKLILKNISNYKTVSNKTAELQMLHLDVKTNQSEAEAFVYCDAFAKQFYFTKFKEPLFCNTLASSKLFDRIESCYQQNESISKFQNAIICGISNDGFRLFFQIKTDGLSSDIYESKLKDREWTPTKKLYGKLNSPWNEGAITLSADNKIVIFSSDRPGGNGGMDLYQAELQLDGSWDNIKALPNSINTNANEDFPFLHPSGNYLFFSSNCDKSIGGYDIFYCTKLSDGTWSEPKNCGIPINSTFDERNFCLDASSKIAYLSSNRSNGNGKEDIYKIVGEIVPSQNLFLVSGKVFLDEANLASEITVMDKSNGAHIGSYFGNASSGNYLFCLPENKVYSLVFSINGYEPKIIELNTENLSSFRDTVLPVYFTSVATTTTSQIVEEKTKTGSNSNNFHSTTSTSTAYYYVQVAAVAKGQNYNPDKFSVFGKLFALDYNDNIIRYAIGKFSTYAEADANRKKIAAQGYKAWIVAEINGQRVNPITLK